MPTQKKNSVAKKKITKKSEIKKSTIRKSSSQPSSFKNFHTGITPDDLRMELQRYIEPEKAEKLPKFFKTFPGGYGEGDKFYGIRVPNIRKVAKRYYSFTIDELQDLIIDPYHEVRMAALVILEMQYSKAKTSVAQRKKIVDFYLKNMQFINNWDLVDVSSPKILGPFLFMQDNHGHDILDSLVASGNLWQQRIAVLATYYFIKMRVFDETLFLSQNLLNHPHDLIHKAVGWMLREIGNRHKPTEVAFLKEHYKIMPRTMLRYAIEKFPEVERQKFLKGEI